MFQNIKVKTRSTIHDIISDTTYRMNSTSFVFTILLFAIGMRESFQQVCSDRYCKVAYIRNVGCAGCCLGSGCNGLAGYCENSKCYCNGCEVKKSKGGKMRIVSSSSRSRIVM
ncbi:uncharacterized protein LOC134723825 isoform X2 [Mytilus trossulus]|uniref:uncharacterized protein LOC134723825 isoform X2 n=1 Tax=Mytilus trossulus TaxID=6551 RepID=UPI003007B56A